MLQDQIEQRERRQGSGRTAGQGTPQGGVKNEYDDWTEIELERH